MLKNYRTTNYALAIIQDYPITEASEVLKRMTKAA